MLNCTEGETAEILHLIHEFVSRSRPFDYEQLIILIRDGILPRCSTKNHIWMRSLIIESVEDFKTLFDSFVHQISYLLTSAIAIDALDDIDLCIHLLSGFSSELEMKASIHSCKGITDACMLMMLTNKLRNISLWFPLVNWKAVCRDTAILDQVLEVVFDSFSSFGNEFMVELTRMLHSNTKALERFLDNPKASQLVHQLIASLNHIDSDTPILLGISGLLLLLTKEEDLMDGESAVRILKISVAALEQTENERLQDIAATLLQVGCHKPLFASRLRRTVMGGLARKLLAMISLAPRKPLVDLAQAIFGTTKLITSDFIPVHSIQLDPLLRWLNGYGFEALQAAKLIHALLEAGFLGDEESVKAICQEIICILCDPEKSRLFGALDRAANSFYGASITTYLMKLLQVCQSRYPQLSLESFTKEVRAQWNADLCWMRRLSISSQLSLIDKSNPELLLWIKLSAQADREGFDFVRKQLFIHQKQSSRLAHFEQSIFVAEEKWKLAQIELHSRIDGLEGGIRQKDEEISEMMQRLSSKDSELLDQANMISQLQMRIAAETINSQEAHRQNSQLQDNIEKLTVELDESKTKFHDIEAQARDQIGDFLLKLESQSMEIQDLKDMKATLEESNALLEADLLMTKDQIEDLQTQLQQANDNAAMMQSAFAQEKENVELNHHNEASMLRSQLSELTARLHSGQELIASLKDELATLRLGEGQLRLQIGSLKDQIEERDRQSKEDRDEIARLSKALYT